MIYTTKNETLRLRQNYDLEGFRDIDAKIELHGDELSVVCYTRNVYQTTAYYSPKTRKNQNLLTSTIGGWISWKTNHLAYYKTW
jgi:hypothetical protein